MRILMTGVSHRSAPLATREALSLTRDQLPEALETLKNHAGHGVILSTCNRTEVYTIAHDIEHGRLALDNFVADQFRIEVPKIRQHLYDLEQFDAVTHLFRVAAGLDSLIIGESEILGQVRDAFGVASREGAAPGVLAHVFHSAIRTGKRARTETHIGKNALSISRACTELARRVLGDLSRSHGLIVGVGEASQLAAKAVADAGVRSIVIANRTPEHAREIAESVNADIASLDELPRLLAEADIVISSTGAPDFVITREQVAEAVARRNGRPLLIIDIAVPRDVAPEAAQIGGVRLFTMEDIEAIAEANRRERESEAVKVEHIVGQEVGKFRHWWDSRGATPTIAEIRRQAEGMRAAEVAKTFAGESGLSSEHAEKVDAMTKALIKKLLHDPTKALRDRKDESFTQAARELFGLDD